MDKRVELGCAGHFIGAKNCRFRRHTQVDGYRISTVGDLYWEGKNERSALGAGEDSFFETYVFKLTDTPVKDNDGCGCKEVAEWSEIDGQRYATAGEALAGHERYVRKYMRKSK